MNSNGYSVIYEGPNTLSLPEWEAYLDEMDQEVILYPERDTALFERNFAQKMVAELKIEIQQKAA